MAFVNSGLSICPSFCLPGHQSFLDIVHEVKELQRLKSERTWIFGKVPIFPDMSKNGDFLSFLLEVILNERPDLLFSYLNPISYQKPKFSLLVRLQDSLIISITGRKQLIS